MLSYRLALLQGDSLLHGIYNVHHACMWVVALGSLARREGYICMHVRYIADMEHGAVWFYFRVYHIVLKGRHRAGHHWRHLGSRTHLTPILVTLNGKIKFSRCEVSVG